MLGGFDETMTRWGYDDTEFFYRVFHHHGQSTAEVVASRDAPDPVDLLPVPFLGDIQAAATGLHGAFPVEVAEYGDASILTIN